MRFAGERRTVIPAEAGIQTSPNPLPHSVDRGLRPRDWRGQGTVLRDALETVGAKPPVGARMIWAAARPQSIRFAHRVGSVAR